MNLIPSGRSQWIVRQWPYVSVTHLAEVVAVVNNHIELWEGVVIGVVAVDELKKRSTWRDKGLCPCSDFRNGSPQPTVCPGRDGSAGAGAESPSSPIRASRGILISRSGCLRLGQDTKSFSQDSVRRAIARARDVKLDAQRKRALGCCGLRTIGTPLRFQG